MKHIVITGGSDGIGKALARSISNEFTITLLARDKDKLKGLAAELKCDFVVCDVRNSQEVEKAFTEIMSRHDSIDVLINNAGHHKR